MLKQVVVVLDALSQLLNAVFLFGEANESISGRAYRSGWIMTERFINMLCFWEKDHCLKAHQADVARAHVVANKYPRAWGRK